MTYSSLTDNTLAKFVEVNEKFADAHTIFGDACLDALLNVTLMTERGRLSLVV